MSKQIKLSDKLEEIQKARREAEKQAEEEKKKADEATKNLEIKSLKTFFSNLLILQSMKRL
ncbi:MAG: hypothetical protein U5K00_22345 [Melioribacteraceae bacterium]|nr:hypothetical protein [Melioribacteraceae bacterium]